MNTCSIFWGYYHQNSWKKDEKGLTYYVLLTCCVVISYSGPRRWEPMVVLTVSRSCMVMWECPQLNQHDFLEIDAQLSTSRKPHETILNN